MLQKLCIPGTPRYEYAMAAAEYVTTPYVTHHHVRSAAGRQSGTTLDPALRTQRNFYTGSNAGRTGCSDRVWCQWEVSSPRGGGGGGGGWRLGGWGP